MQNIWHFAAGFIALFSLVFLVVFHELGHALSAQYFGIPIQRFAIGFGKVLLSKTSSHSNIEYALCAFPLGGYVKFRHQHDYDSAPIYKRFLIVLAGPFANLVIAFFAYWLVFMIGTTSALPLIEKTLPHTPLAQYTISPGTKIIAVDHFSVQTWAAILYRLFPHLGNRNDSVTLTVLPPLQDKPVVLSLAIDKWQLDPLKPDMLALLGIVPYKNAPQVTRQYGLWQSMQKSTNEISLYLSLNTTILVKLFTGKLSLGLLAGPLSLFSSTMHAARQGFVNLLAFTGFVSTSLFFANLLPIPGLDGSYLLYCIIELIRGKPLSTRYQILLLRLGIIFICVIMIQTLMNDLIRLF